MNKELFESYLKNPTKLGKAESEELQAILEQYPYFQTAHLLYVKSLHNFDSIKYQSQLRQAATHCINRTKLFYLIKRKSENNNPILEETNLGTLQTANQSGDEKQAVQINTNEAGTLEPRVTNEETNSKGKEVLAVSDLEAEVTSEKEADIQSERINAIPSDDELNGKISAENNTLQETATPMSSEHKEEDLADKILRRIEELKAQNTEAGQTKNGNEKPDESSLLDFDYNVDIKEEKKKQDKPNKGEKNTLQPQFTDYMYHLGANDDSLLELDDRTDDEKRKKEASIIDKFLETNPRITPKRDPNVVRKEKEQKDISEDSVKDKEFMSETLAKIYLSQEEYDKAMKIYQKLSLKYPQKSAYFADQIKMIKNLNQSDNQ